MALAFCTSAFADPSKDGVQLPKEQPAKKVTRKVFYTYIGNSKIPQPCDRVAGPIPTTVSPMDIIR
jgi:hypothetical protein